MSACCALTAALRKPNALVKALSMGLFVVTVAGCAPRTQPIYQPSAPKETIVQQGVVHGSFNQAMRAAVQSLMGSESLQGAPVTLVQPLQNLTDGYIDTVGVSKQLEQGLAAQGLIGTVSQAQVDVVRQSLGLGEGQVLIDPTTVMQYGRLLGAQYQLGGKVTGQEEKTLSLQLMDLTTGVIEWQDTQRFVSR
ncbi:hypothetical protein BZG82_08605 [Salinivibrio sp. PR5]|uniref:hypothetical protein n=1 Tax=Salinivibrio sp. PR5 TaxID=1909484 RepID=UPI00098A72B9|nr:hypothetical protein [Salinivibrio sp. PR5]OOF10133.1 hypothetical protein BZG82_08605 [Salinivibrio sp. PR5]